MELISFLLRSSRGMVAAVIVASGISGLLGGAMIAVVTRALAHVDQEPVAILLAFVLVVGARIGSQFVSAMLLVRFAQETVLRLSRMLCEQVLRASLERVERMGPSRILAALTEDVSTLSSAVMSLPIVATNLAMIFGCSIYLAYLSWKVLLACVVLAALGVLGQRILLRHAERSIAAVRADRDRLLEGFATLTGGLKELKLHRARREDFMQREIVAVTDSLRVKNMQATRHYMLADSWAQLLFYILIGSLLFLVPLASRMTREELTGYVFAALYMMAPTWTVLGAVPNFLKGRVALDKIRELGAGLDQEPMGVQGGRPADQRVLIELRGVSFTYPSESGDERGFTVGPIDLSLTSGEVVFVAGGNGSGKSTLVKLLTGLYVPTSGQVLLNGKSIDHGSREEYREQFATVFADYHLFNELFGLDTAARAQEISAYLDLLRLDRKVRVADGRFSSIALSSGQRKRLALLTAFLEDRPVYVFDEWAADQDPSYKEIFYLRLLPELRSRGKCVVVVTHDDRYFEAGDRLIKLEAGKPVRDPSRPILAARG